MSYAYKVLTFDKNLAIHDARSMYRNKKSNIPNLEDAKKRAGRYVKETHNPAYVIKVETNSDGKNTGKVFSEYFLVILSKDGKHADINGDVMFKKCDGWKFGLSGKVVPKRK